MNAANSAVVTLNYPEPDIAAITFDDASKGANVLSSKVLGEFSAALDAASLALARGQVGEQVVVLVLRGRFPVTHDVGQRRLLGEGLHKPLRPEFQFLLPLAVFGPETSVQAYVVIFPVASVAVPVRVAVLVGKVIAWFEPALTTGAWFGGLTVMVTVDDPDRLFLSTTSN